MYQKEFELIWEVQANYYPKELNVANRKAIYDAIFFQRPLKIQKHLVGECEFEPGRKRAPATSLIAQEFRLWSSINNLRILLGNGSERPLTDKERLMLHDNLANKKELSWDKIRDLLNLFETDRFNLERVRKSNLQGNKTAALVISCLGAKNWKALGNRQQEDLVHDLVFLDDESLKKRLQRHWRFESDVIDKLLKKSLELPKGYMHLSQKAMRNIVKHLSFAETEDNRGLTYDQACLAAGYVHTKPQRQKNLETLPFPGTPARKRGKHQESLITTAGLRNPMVERALFQVRRVVNSIIGTYGKPEIIRIEMARDLKNNAKQRSDIQKHQRENEQANQEGEKFLREEMRFSSPSGTDKLKYRLWQECGHVCVFSGRSINAHDLFVEPQFQIEHIVPYSRCLDDSYMNKTLCYVEWNQRKGNQTPAEAFTGDEYEAMLQRAKQLPYAKFRRFATDAIKSLDEFVSQQLNETRYIAVKTAEYLKQLGVRVDHVKGGTTAILRRAWELDGLLSDNGEKTRLDHRHHAVDAIVTALTDRNAVRKINTYSNRTHHGRIRTENYSAPITDVRKKTRKLLDNMVVSHKHQHKIKGPLHKEFLYSLTGKVDASGTPIVAIRKKLTDMKADDLDHIRDLAIQELAKKHLAKSKNYNDAFKNPDNPFGMMSKKGKFIPIHKVRLIYNRSVTSIGKPLSAKNDKRRNVWTMGNHHAEIVEYKDEAGYAKWKAHIISTLEATLRNAGKTNYPVIRTDHSNGERFLLALHPNDMVKLTHKGREKICRVQKMDINENIVFREHCDSDIKDWSKQIKFSPNSLKNANICLLEIDPLGKILKEISI
jgi:CRISPR-associated endonuclease Csn1